MRARFRLLSPLSLYDTKLKTSVRTDDHESMIALLNILQELGEEIQNPELALSFAGKANRLGL